MPKIGDGTGMSSPAPEKEADQALNGISPDKGPEPYGVGGTGKGPELEPSGNYTSPPRKG